jgi:hypothetical protein
VTRDDESAPDTPADVTGTVDTAPADPTGAPAPKGNLPPWAWGLIGLAVGLLVVGGAWAFYESGRSTDQRDASGSGETSATASGDTSVAMMPTENTPAEEPVEPTAADAPPASDPPPTADTPASGPPPASIPTLTLGPQYKYTPKLYPIPTTWTKAFEFSKTDPWEMPYPPGIVLTKGYLRVTVLATDNGTNSGYVQLVRKDGDSGLKDYGVLYSWPAGTGNVVYKMIDPVLVEAGTYQLRASIHGPWTIMLEK